MLELLTTDPLSFELPADARIDEARRAAIDAAVGLGGLPQWAAFRQEAS